MAYRKDPAAFPKAGIILSLIGLLIVWFFPVMIGVEIIALLLCIRGIKADKKLATIGILISSASALFGLYLWYAFSAV